MFDWIAKIAIQKSVNRGLKTFLGGSAGTLAYLQQFGITVHIDKVLLANAIVGVLHGLYEFLRNYQKSKGAENAPQLP